MNAMDFVIFISSGENRIMDDLSMTLIQTILINYICLLNNCDLGVRLIIWVGSGRDELFQMIILLHLQYAVC